MARVRLAADVDAELRRRVKLAAISRDKSVSDWIEEAVRRELDREVREDAAGISGASASAFGRDWGSEEDSAYDGLAG